MDCMCFINLCVCVRSWLVFSDLDFQGLLSVLPVGEYPCPESWGFPDPFVGSLRPLKMVQVYCLVLIHLTNIVKVLEYSDLLGFFLDFRVGSKWKILTKFG